MELKVWVLSGVILFGSGVLWWIVKEAIKGIYERLDRMIEQNDATNRRIIEHDGKIAGLDRRVETNETRLNDHAGRIRNLEINN